MQYCCVLARQYSNPTVEEQLHDRKSNSVLREYEAEPRRSEYFESIRSHLGSFGICCAEIFASDLTSSYGRSEVMLCT
jgi:hypothetical protein